jgi:hypothetical protein
MQLIPQPMINAILLTESIENAKERVLSAFPIDELDAVIGQDGVDLVRYSSDEVAQELGGEHLVRFFRQLGLGELAHTADGNEQGELTFFHTYLSSTFALLSAEDRTQSLASLMAVPIS